jgi:repressor LexA
MKEPTKRQEEVLAFIGEYIEDHAYPPTIRDVADYFSISVKGAHDHITALQKKGLLRHGDKKSRTLELVKDGVREEPGIVEIPILGTVAAGKPILSEENWDGTIRFSRAMLKRNSEYFALRVRGDSMEGAGIMDGDIAVIEKQNTAGNGNIAVVATEDGVTLKTFYRENSRVKLQSENPKYKPIYCNRNVQVLGRLAHIYRSYDSGDSLPAT